MTEESIRDAYGGRRIVVSGGAGYLAHGLALALADIPCSVLLLARPGGRLPDPPAGVAHVEILACDVRMSGAWQKALEGADVIFHLAAQTSAPVADADPPADLDANVMPMLHLLEACRSMRAAPVVLFAGTVTAAGVPQRLPVAENHPDRPVTVYDLHKLVAERYLGHYARLGIVRGATLRLANVFGPGPRSGSGDRGILNQMISKAVRGETLTVFGSGDSIRDYVFIDDVIAAFLSAGRAADNLDGRHFVIGSGRGRRIIEAVTEIADRVGHRTGLRSDVVHVEPPVGLLAIDARDFVADIGAFRAVTGWEPSVRFGDGIERTIDALLGAEVVR